MNYVARVTLQTLFLTQTTLCNISVNEIVMVAEIMAMCGPNIKGYHFPRLNSLLLLLNAQALE